MTQLFFIGNMPSTTAQGAQKLLRSKSDYRCVCSIRKVDATELLSDIYVYMVMELCKDVHIGRPDSFSCLSSFVTLQVKAGNRVSFKR